MSWSGKRSKAMANALKDWIPLIVQHSEPFVSDKDISAGDRWAQAIAGELESSNFGILCITPENISSEWIMLEAGALSKAMQDAKVIPLLFGLELSDLSGPLQQFQALKVDEQGMLDALKAINAASDNKTDEATIERLVPALWSDLQAKIDAIPERAEAEKHMRPQTEIMEDLVSQVRGLNTRMRDFDPEIMERGMHQLGSKHRNFHPMMIDEMMMTSKDPRHGGYGLVMLAGMLRDTMPWISEVLLEAHRELKNASPKQARKVALDLRRTLKFMTRSHFAEIMMDESKHSHMLMMELPHTIERFVDRIETRHIGEGVDGELEGDDLI
ncbi:MAG: toll/interleukin-1 receptor domain-containing protein [Planktotalea sp.]|nr:toll/interleukin-1 receptor domain-containing protein [Planktotalea sp.]MDG1083327.1 toll/interleukin-1 receptor domain-containing protein [Planktotalea sp.]